MRFLSIVILSFLFFATGIHNAANAQSDSICFYKADKKSSEITIPINEYPVKIKPAGEKYMTGRIKHYNDSAWTVRVQCRKKERNAIEQKYGREAWFAIRNGNYTNAQQDSISRRADSLKREAIYAREMILNIGDIKVIKISNRDRAETKNKIRTVDNIGGAVTLAFLLSMAIQSAPVSVSFAALGAGFCVVSFVTENKRITLQNGWKIKHSVQK